QLRGTDVDEDRMRDTVPFPNRLLRSRASVRVGGRLVAGTASRATPGDRAERFHGDRSQPAAG
ncbi:MAG TPA: hypothetical protein VGJ23_02025, partial [Gaiellaceae bacterium]